jgi:uncharacterized protein (TIGR00251 family)
MSSSEALSVRPTPTGGRFEIRVTTRASRAAIAGVREGRLLVRVTAPPVDGAANDAIVRLLADAMGVPPRDVRILAGATGRLKVIEVVGVSAGELAGRLGVTAA